VLREDAGRGFRRYVPSPRPLEIVEEAGLKTLLASGLHLIAGGGGGIPVFRTEGGYEGVDAVVDKDLTSCLLAKRIKSDLFVISTAVSTILGTTAALALHKYRYKWQGLLNGLIYLPILIPEIVMGLSLLVLFSQIHLSLGRTSIILAHITFCLSFVVITVGARLDGLKQEYEEAAGDLYARPWQCFRYITLPLIMPGITAGALIAFTLSIDDFIISFFAAGPNSTTLPLYIYAMVKRGISPEINALSTLMIAAEITLILLADFFQIRQAGTGRKKELPDDRH